MGLNLFSAVQYIYGGVHLAKEVTYFEVCNEEDLLEGFQRKEEYILIQGEYNQEVKKLTGSKLSDKELIGIELGSSGLVYVFSELVYKVLNAFSDEPKSKKKLEDAIRLYNVKIDEDKRIILYLRQFDY